MWKVNSLSIQTQTLMEARSLLQVGVLGHLFY